MSSKSAAVRRTAEPALVRSGATIYAGAGAIGTLEAAIPGGTPFSLAPALAAFLIAGRSGCSARGSRGASSSCSRRSASR